jgi:hypothetical protein
MKYILAGILTAVMLTGCVYTHVTMPLSTDLNRTELGNKRGEASMSSYFWLVAIGDAGAAAAAKQGGITVMTHMDREYKSVFYGIYTKTTTLVYGD